MKIEKYLDKKEKTHKFRARFQLNNKEFYPTADSRKKLLEIIDEIRANEHRAKFDLPTQKVTVTLAEFINKYIETLDLKKKNHRQRKSILLDFLGTFDDDFNLLELGTPDISDFVRAKQAKSKLKPWSVHSLLTIISSALHSAPDLIKNLSDYRPPRIPWVKIPQTGAGRVITLEERLKLLEALRAPRQKIEVTMKTGVKADRLEQLRDVFTRHELADMFELALNTGMRWGEIKQLEWRWFDRTEKLIKLPAGITKTEKSRIIYLSENILLMLEKRKLAAKTKWIFPNGENTSYRKYYSKPLRTVAKRIGLHYGQELTDGFTPHSTRHTAGTLLVRLTDLKTAGEMLGHSDKRMTMLYTHTEENRKRSAADQISDVLFDGKK